MSTTKSNTDNPSQDRGTTRGTSRRSVVDLYELVKEVDSTWPSDHDWDNQFWRSKDDTVEWRASRYESARESGYGVGNSFERHFSVNSQPFDIALQEAIADGEGEASAIGTLTIDQEGRDEVGRFNDHSSERCEVTITFRRVGPSSISCFLRFHLGQEIEVTEPRYANCGVLLQTQFLQVVGTHQHGQLVKAVSIPWIAILRELDRDPDFLYEFVASPRKFEEFIATAYEQAGWDEVILTPRSADGGRDVIAIKHGIGALRFLEQCKAYRPNHLVEANDVRALIGVLAADPNASKGIVTTTSGFAPGIPTDPSIAPFLPYRLELRSGKELLQWLAMLRDHPASW